MERLDCVATEKRSSTLAASDMYPVQRQSTAPAMSVDTEMLIWLDETEIPVMVRSGGIVMGKVVRTVERETIGSVDAHSAFVHAPAVLRTRAA
jgi:hypothetical protein